MKNSEINQLIGKYGRFSTEGMIFRVNILDARSSFGRTDLEITPADGSGSKWVSMERVSITS